MPRPPTSSGWAYSTQPGTYTTSTLATKEAEGKLNFYLSTDFSSISEYNQVQVLYGIPILNIVAVFNDGMFPLSYKATRDTSENTVP